MSCTSPDPTHSVPSPLTKEPNSWIWTLRREAPCGREVFFKWSLDQAPIQSLQPIGVKRQPWKWKIQKTSFEPTEVLGYQTTPPWCRSDGAAPSCSWGDILQGGFPLPHKSTKNCTWRPPSPHNELLYLENYWTVHMAMLKKLYELSVVPWATNQLFPFILQGKVRRERDCISRLERADWPIGGSIGLHSGRRG